MGRKPRISREILIETARTLFVAKGFASTTLADIASELSVTPAAILRHVGSKQALFAEAMAAGEIRIPDAIANLPATPGDTDPRIVLRAIATEFIPFARGMISSRFVVDLHERSRPALELPFRPDAEDSPPKRGIALVADYFRRASEAGRIRIEDPKAAALLFMGALNSYVLFHEVLKIATSFPVETYIDALIDLWENGGIAATDGGKRGPQRRRIAKDRSPAGTAPDRGGDLVLPAANPKAAGRGALGDDRGAHGKRGVADRRPRRPRSR